MYRLYIDLGVQKTSIMWEQFLILTGVMHLSNPASSAGPDKNEKKKKMNEWHYKPPFREI